MKMLCNGCGSEVEIVERVGFRQVCQVCGAWLHSCVNCRFQVAGSCSEPSAEKVPNPEAQNFCEWYRGNEGTSTGEKKETGTKDAAEEMWKNLTKK